MMIFLVIVHTPDNLVLRQIWGYILNNQLLINN
jgi:hypothetical protein